VTQFLAFQINICRRLLPGAAYAFPLDNLSSGTQTTRVSCEELRRRAARYYGQTVTVDGELHRTLSDRLFTICGMSFLKEIVEKGNANTAALTP